MTGLGPTPFGPVLIIGTGMMGCSMGRLIRREYPMASVFGLDRDPRVSAAAAEAGHVTAGYGIDRMQRLVAEAGLVILATPVEEIIRLLPELDRDCATGSMVLDLGSTKQQICLVAADQPRIRRGEVGFVGGHPMGGSVHSGVAAASEGRLRDAPFLYCPVGGVLSDAVDKLTKFLSKLDFRPMRVQPSEHDRVVAAISHTPHVIAAVLSRWVGAKAETERVESPLHYRASGRGLGAMTAKAAASPALWTGILSSNAEPVSRSLREVAASLARMADVIESGDRDLLKRLLIEAQGRRRALESLGFDPVPEGKGPAE